MNDRAELLGLSATDWQRDKPVISAHWGTRSESAEVAAVVNDEGVEVVFREADFSILAQGPL